MIFKRKLISSVVAIASAGSALPTVANQAEKLLQLEEVVVTARKREETLFDVPMSLDVFSGDAIEAAGIETSVDLVGVVPGISTSGDLLSPGKDFTYIVTRGVGANTGGDPSTPVFLDGVYQPRLAFDTGFMAVERVEILKGPQGSVFGRNSEGGAINIVTKRPQEEFSGRLRFEVDEFDGFKTQALVNLPLTDNLFSSIAVEGERIGAYLRNTTIGNNLQGDLQQSPGGVDANDGTRRSARFALNYVGENLDVYFTVDAARFEGLNGLPGVPRGCNCYEVQTEFQIDAVDTNHGASLHIEYDMDWATLTSITGYRKLSTKLPFDLDGGTRFTDSIHDFRSKQEFISEEIRLSSNGDGNISWLAGLFYFTEELDSQRGYDLPNNPVLPGLFIIDQDVTTDREGVAVFANADFVLNDSLTLTLGGRYSTEDIDGDFFTDYTIASFGLHVVEADTESDTFESVTGNVSLRYYINEDIVSYITFSQGFKAGGYPVAPISATDFVAFSEEESTNYEIGVKADLFDNRVSLEAAIFHIELEEQQLSTVIEVNDLPVAAIANAGESHVDGAELEVKALIAEGLTLNLALGYTDTEFDDYVDANGIQRAGEPFRFTPELTANIGINYNTLLSNQNELDFALSYRFVDDYIQGTAGIDTPFDIDSYELMDASVTLSNDAWSLQLFVDNLTDEYVETRAFDAFFFSVNGSDAFSTVLPPRRAGVRFTYNF